VRQHFCGEIRKTEYQMCVEGEDAYYTRRQDVLTPTRDYVNEILDVLLPLSGIKNSGEVRRLVKVLQDYDWPKLASACRRSTRQDAKNSLYRTSPAVAKFCSRCMPDEIGNIVVLRMSRMRSIPERMTPLFRRSQEPRHA